MLRATTASQISADLITPLGAYLRLRDNEPSFLLESVEQGRLGRYSFLGAGARLRLVRGRGGRSRGRRPGRGLPRLRPRRPPRADGAAPRRRPRPAREPLRRRAHPRPLRSPRGPGRGPRGRPRRGRRATRRPAGRAPGLDRSRRRAAPALSVPGPVRARRAAGQGLHPGGRRIPDRPLTARRAADGGVGSGDLPGAPARQPLAVPLPARARRRRPRRLLARDARQARGNAGQRQPDRGDDAARGGRRRAAARLGEGPGGARHARRSRPQRPLPRLHRGEP